MPFKSNKPDFTPENKNAVLNWIFDNIVCCPSGCWLYTGADSGTEGRGAGYAKIKLPRSRKTAYLHRIIYWVFKGPIPKGYQVDHICKHWAKTFAFAHRRCINPDHLEAVTQSDNIKRNNLGDFLCTTN